MADPPAAGPSVGGPIELAVIEFPGSNFTGEIAPELAGVVVRGIVTILDLVFVTKQLDGSTTSTELA
jgi:hypothetical protein